MNHAGHAEAPLPEDRPKDASVGVGLTSPNVPS
jgi:hypothetical protein